MPSDPSIHTPRLTLSTWREDDAARLLDIRGRPEIARWLGDPTPWTSIDTAHEAIRDWAERTSSRPPLGVWAIRPVDRPPAGTVSLSTLPDESDEFQIGWNLHPDSQGRGYAREAAAAVLARAFDHGIARVWAIMWPHNDASAAVARAIGMRDLGVVPDPWYGSDEEPTSRMFRAERA